MSNVDLKNIEQNREQEMYQNALMQLEKIHQHGVFYISTKSDVETVALVKRYILQHNVRELNTVSDEATGTLMTVKHFVPRVNPLPDEYFSKTEIEQKLNAAQNDEFAYITGITNAVIKDMFSSFRDTYQGNINERTEFIDKFKEILARSIDANSKDKINKAKYKAIEQVVNAISLEASNTEEIDQNLVNKVVESCFTEITNITKDQKEKLKNSVQSNVGALTHVYLIPSYILRTTNDRLVYSIQYLLEMVMSSYYEMKRFVNNETPFNICNNYKIAFIGQRDDRSHMPVTGYKSIELDVLPKDMVDTYLDIYQSRMQDNSFGDYENSFIIPEETKEKFYEVFKTLSFLEFITLINDMASNDIVINDVFIETNKNFRVDKTLTIKPIRSSLTLDMIAGIDNIYEYAVSLQKSLKNPAKLVKYNIPAEKGVLLAGLSGTAKSTIAKAFGNFLGIPVYQFEVGSFMSFLVGKSENNIKSFLTAIANEGKVVLWIDEFEKAFAGASSEVTDSGTSNRVYQIFLTFLQENENVILVATANDITRLPVEFMRSGRFDKKFFIDIPSYTDRREIFKVILKRHNLVHIINENNCDMFAKLTEHYTGADIQTVVTTTIRTNLDVDITAEQIVEEITKHKPDAQSFKNQYKALRKLANDFEPASKNRNESRHLGFEDYVTFVKTDLQIEDVGGLDLIKRDLAELKNILDRSAEAKKFGIKIIKNFLLSGVPGTGKSLIIKATANFLQKKLFRIDLGSLFSKYVGESFANVKAALDAAESLSQEETIILWLDELEKLFNNMDNSSYESHILQYFLTWLEEQDKVIVMATANNLSKIPVELIRSGRFDNKYFIDLPSTEERKHIIKSVLGQVNKSIEMNHVISDLDEIAENTKYFSGSDVKNVIDIAVKRSFIEKNSLLDNGILLNILQDYRPDSKTHSAKYQAIREDYGAMFQPASSEAKFSERLDMGKFLRKEDLTNFNFVTVGGMENIKSYIAQSKVVFLNADQAFEFGVAVPKGVLLGGYSGCGKTAIAKAIANDLGVEMFSLMMSDIINTYVGGSEANFKKVIDSIKLISKEKKIVFFIDEFDKAFANSHSEHRNNILQEFLVFLQNEHPNIFIVATANDTTQLPPELMRSGRFDKKFFVGLPSKKERVAILNGVITKINKGFDIPEITLEAVAQKMDGYTGADIENVINMVIAQKFINQDFGKTLTETDFNSVLETYTSDKNMLKYQVDTNTLSHFTPASNEQHATKMKPSVGFHLTTNE